MFDFSICQSPWGRNRGSHQLLGCGSIEQLLFTRSPANARQCFQCFSSTVSFNLYNTSSKRAQRNNSCLINEENEAVLGWSRQETDAYLGLKPQESYQENVWIRGKREELGSWESQGTMSRFCPGWRREGESTPERYGVKERFPGVFRMVNQGAPWVKVTKVSLFSWGCVHLVMAFRCCDPVLVILPKVGSLQDSLSWLPKSSVSLIHSKSHS